MSVWAAGHGPRAESLRRTAADALEEEGVRLEPWRGDPSGPGVLFFDSASNELCELVEATSHRGSDRVIAIGVEAGTLSCGDAWRVMDAGASDVVVWDDRRRCARHVAARFARWREVDELMATTVVRHGLVGESLTWRVVLRQVVEVAHFTDAPVLIMGESGTGKELVARLIHALDARAGKANIVLVDCSTIVPTLSGSEFFGHERGAFTGSVSTREGAFALADGGTLFLDEIGELPLPLQAELLRVVQEGTYKRVGSNTWRNTSFRLICATNRDLLAEAEQNRFRLDLYHRIAGWTFRLPSLRERAEDILPLAAHFLAELRPDREPPDLDAAVREFMLARPYPGNVRELRYLVMRLSHRHVGPGPLSLGDIPDEDRLSPPAPDDWEASALDEPLRRALRRGATLKEIGSAASATAVRIALAEEDGNVSRAARRLGVTARALQLRRASLARADRDRYSAAGDGDGNGSPSSGN
jgi:transcriptional regulator with GAF, ATPase, and Fis domain